MSKLKLQSSSHKQEVLCTLSFTSIDEEHFFWMFQITSNFKKNFHLYMYVTITGPWVTDEQTVNLSYISKDAYDHHKLLLCNSWLQTLKHFLNFEYTKVAFTSLVWLKIKIEISKNTIHITLLFPECFINIDFQWHQVTQIL